MLYLPTSNVTTEMPLPSHPTLPHHPPPPLQNKNLDFGKHYKPRTQSHQHYTVCQYTSQEPRAKVQFSRGTACPTRLLVRPAKTQISQSAYPHSLIRVFTGHSQTRLQTDSEVSDKTALMRWPICFFSGRSCNLVGNAVSRLRFSIYAGICGVVQWQIV